MSDEVSREDCRHMEGEKHFFKWPVHEGRSVWNPFGTVCSKCGKTLGEVLLSTLDERDRLREEKRAITLELVEATNEATRLRELLKDYEANLQGTQGILEVLRENKAIQEHRLSETISHLRARNEKLERVLEAAEKLSKKNIVGIYDGEGEHLYPEFVGVVREDYNNMKDAIAAAEKGSEPR